MPEALERRGVPRIRLTEQPTARVRGVREVRLRDLSLTGAQIEHLDLLRPGAPCELDLREPARAGTLPAQIVWCTVVGRKQQLGGEWRLVSRSGLRFPTLTDLQTAALADSLQRLAAARHPVLNSQQHSV